MDKKKKFCFFTSVGRDNYEVIVYRRAKSLRESGYNTLFVVNDDKGESYIEDTRVVSTGIIAGGYLKRILFNPWRTFKKLKSIDADVYQTYSVDLLFVCVLLKLCGKKVIFDLREDHPYSYYLKSRKPKLVNHILVSIMALFMKLCLKNVDVVIAATDAIEAYLRKWGIKRVITIGNFPVLNPNHVLTYEDYIKRKPCLLYYGSIYVISRQEIILDALSKAENVNYLLAGKFEYEYYKKEIEKHPYWNHVDFRGVFDKKQLEEFYKEATMSNVLRDFAVTNYKEGSLGIIKLFESMEAGLPIICANVPVYQKLMNEYKCGLLVNPTDVSEILHAIQYLATNKKEAFKMGQMGRKAVEDKYSWNALSKVYVNLIDNL